MARRRMKLSDQVRQAVDASGMSRYEIGKAAGIDKGLLSKFMSGKRNMSVPTLDALADVLNLNIVAGDSAAPKRRKGKVKP